MENINDMVKRLFDYVMNNGEVSQKRNILTMFSSNDNVYTKKVKLSDKKLKISGCIARYISLTSNSGKFDDVNPSDLRVNFTNWFDAWVNVPVESLSVETLNKIAEALKIK